MGGATQACISEFNKLRVEAIELEKARVEERKAADQVRFIHANRSVGSELARVCLNPFTGLPGSTQITFLIRKEPSFPFHVVMKHSRV